MRIPMEEQERLRSERGVTANEACDACVCALNQRILYYVKYRQPQPATQGRFRRYMWPDRRFREVYSRDSACAMVSEASLPTLLSRQEPPEFKPLDFEVNKC